jgi:ligand-binding sensor domain-containing protein/two-component sensor histidine kinase
MSLQPFLCDNSKRSLLFLLSLLSGWAPSVYSQVTGSRSLQFENLTINDGLSQGFVSGISQDRHGLMWITTSDGLNKYDGYNFTVYHHDPDDPYSIGSDDLTCVFEDSERRLWVGTRQNGLDLFDRENNRFYHIRNNGSEGLRSNSILNISEDQWGGLWVRTREGIDRLVIRPLAQPVKDKRVKNEFPASIAWQHINIDTAGVRPVSRFDPENIFIDKRGRIFVTTTGKVLELLFGTDHTTYTIKERFEFAVIDSTFIPAMLEDTINGNLLLNTREIIRFPGFGVPAKIYDHASNNVRWTLDRKGELWLADGDSLALLDVKTGVVRAAGVSKREHSAALRSPTVFYTDRTGVIWIGTGGYGILRYDPELEFFHHRLAGTPVYQIVQSGEFRIITNQFLRINVHSDNSAPDERLINAGMASQLPKSTVQSFSPDKAGNLWMGIKGGLIYYNLPERKVYRHPLPPEMSDKQPFPVFVDQSDQVWTGYDRYLVKYDPGTGTFHKAEYPYRSDVYDYDFLQCIYQDGDLLWLGAAKGVFCFNIKLQQFVAPAEGNDKNWFSQGFIYAFCQDPQEPGKYLWMATKGMGLNRLDKITGIVTRFDAKKGLINNVVYGILPDHQGNLWLSTNKGLSRFTIADASFRNFDVSDGLQSNEFNRYSFLRLADGRLVFGGMNGINFFDPAAITTLEPPPVILTELRLFNKAVLPAVGGSPLLRAIEFTRNIVLAYDDNVFTLQFAAMDYRKHGNIRYRYRLNGFDRDWIYSGKLHEATYTNLDPGTYEFSIQAAYENGSWGTAAATIQIDVTTPWWRTWWFYCLLGIAVSTSIYLLYRFRLAQLRRLTKLRDSIARDLHDEVGSSISTIAIYSKIVHEQVNNTTFDNEPLLKKINEQASEIMESMNDIVWNINTRNDAFEHIFSRMREHGSQLLEAGNYALHFKFDTHLQHMRLNMEKRRDFYLIYKESVNNIAKYAGGKNAWISLTLNGNNLELSIRDDGKGFDINHPRSGGNGLSNIRFRAKALNGKVHFDSTPGEGTHVYLIFPVN